jgi:metal-responsive CopG/Arc/MetJ family transcriptional regulator
MSASYTARMSRSAKVMVSIPDELLERIDREVDERGTSRSAFLQEAAQHELAGSCTSRRGARARSSRP